MVACRLRGMNRLLQRHGGEWAICRATMPRTRWIRATLRHGAFHDESDMAGHALKCQGCNRAHPSNIFRGINNTIVPNVTNYANKSPSPGNKCDAKMPQAQIEIMPTRCRFSR
jgi:hypothetical protein